jgi:hypothetical protein
MLFGQYNKSVSKLKEKGEKRTDNRQGREKENFLLRIRYHLSEDDMERDGKEKTVNVIKARNS